MLVTKELPYSKVQSPTSAYLNSETLQQSTSVSLKLNEELLSTPTSPHFNRIWRIKIDGSIMFYTTPDNLFRDTGLKKYFRNLFEYQAASGIIEPKDLSTYKYRKLYTKFKSFLNEYSVLVSEKQKSALIEILYKLAKTTDVSIKELNIQANADNEIVVFKKSESGIHYIVVGDDKTDVSYLFISNNPGVYSSLHLSNKITINNIIESFSGE